MELKVPGDKSISQRALILGSLAEGESSFRGLLATGDPGSTAGLLGTWEYQSLPFLPMAAKYA